MHQSFFTNSLLGGKRLSNASAAVGATPSGSGVASKLPVRSYRVSVMGAADVGKSSLTSQFLSSQHMNTYDTVGQYQEIMRIRIWTLQRKL